MAKGVEPEKDQWGLTAWDWMQAQGGKPKVEKTPDGLTHVTHDYPGGSGAEVTSHKSVEEYGEVPVTLGKARKKTRMFPIALLWGHHGQPCETESKKTGGEGYDRPNKNKKR